MAGRLAAEAVKARPPTICRRVAGLPPKPSFAKLSSAMSASPRRVCASVAPSYAASTNRCRLCRNSSTAVRHSMYVGSAINSRRWRGRANGTSQIEPIVAAGPFVSMTIRSREQHRLLDVVRDHQDGVAELRVDLHDLLLQVRARQRVECAERLVEQQHLGLHRERARNADALLHAAGNLAGLLVTRRASCPRARGCAPSIRDARRASWSRRRSCRRRGARSGTPLSHGSSEWFWNTTARSGPGSTTSRPSTNTLPVVASRQPGDDVEQSRLAAARVADDRDVLAFRTSARCRAALRCRFALPKVL